MASKALGSPLTRHVLTRGYAQAAPAFKAVEPKLLSSVLPNKAIVAALDNGSPVTRITIAFKAGSRYEPQSELGLSHVLRSAAGLSTQNASSFIICRKLAQAGAAVSASGDREFVYYTLEATQDNIHAAVEQLNNIVSNQEFRAWELDDNVARLKYDIACLTPQVRAVDLLHKAAYRRGLGNSLFIAPKKLGKISSESLKHFAANTLTPARCSVVVIGDNQDRANLVVQGLQLSCTGDAKADVTTYYGGELRKEMGGELAHVAIALQGAAAGTPQSLALAVVAKVLGNGPVTKWGSDNSPLAKAIGNIGPFAVAGFNVSYSDNGLFGVVLSAPKDEANTAVKCAAAILKNPSLSDEAINAGKAQLKLQVLSEADDGTSLGESLAAQALYTGKIRTPAEIAKDIDQVNSKVITQTLQSVVKSPISMASVGNLAFVPYRDEI